MPVKRCRSDGKSGYKWGDEGKCYTYESGNKESRDKAKRKAVDQGVAIGDIGEGEKSNMSKKDYRNSHIQEFGQLSNDRVEIVEQEGKDPIARVTIIEEGISKNRFRYSKERIKELADLIEKSGRNKLFLNHRKSNRDLEEWGATRVKHWTETENGKLKIKADVDFKGAPKGQMLLEAMRHHPEEVGLSIDTFGAVKEEETDDGDVIRDVMYFTQYNSTDFVDNPSAGGKTDQLMEMTTDLDIVEALHASLSDELEKRTEKTKIHTLMYLFLEYLDRLNYSYDYDTDEEKRNYIDELVSDFMDEFDNLDIVRAYESYVNTNKEDNDMSKFENKTQLVAEHPEVAAILEAEREDAVNEYQDKAESQSELNKLQEQMKDMEAKVENLEKEKGTLEDTISEQKQTISEYKLKEEQAEHKANVVAKVNESDLKDFSELPDFVQEALLSAKDEEKLEEAIKSFEAITSDAGVIRDMGDTKSRTKDTNTDVTEAVNLDDDDAVAAML